MKEVFTIFDLLAAITWLGGGNYVIYESIKRQGLPWYSYFSPFSVLQAQDWLKILGLVIMTSVIMILRFNLSQ